MKCNRDQSSCRRGGFSLVELLVVIAIIGVLAVLSLTITSRIRLAAAKTKSISQMRNISVGIASWMGDNSSLEPFYFSDGTGDYPHESIRFSKFRPGNPARALYVAEDPSSGYVQDFNVFFSPLSKLVAMSPPSESTYDPAMASESRFWGSYSYWYPHATQATLTDRQRTLGVQPIPASRPSLDGTLVLSEFYRDDWITPRFGKQVYHALLSDWSVRHVADNSQAWGKWKEGR